MRYFIVWAVTSRAKSREMNQREGGQAQRGGWRLRGLYIDFVECHIHETSSIMLAWHRKDSAVESCSGDAGWGFVSCQFIHSIIPSSGMTSDMQPETDACPRRVSTNGEGNQATSRGQAEDTRSVGRLEAVGVGGAGHWSATRKPSG